MFDFFSFLFLIPCVLFFLTLVCSLLLFVVMGQSEFFLLLSKSKENSKKDIDMKVLTKQSNQSKRSKEKRMPKNEKTYKTGKEYM